jgi:hypothetical protein
MKIGRIRKHRWHRVFTFITGQRRHKDSPVCLASHNPRNITVIESYSPPRRRRSRTPIHSLIAQRCRRICSGLYRTPPAVRLAQIRLRERFVRRESDNCKADRANMFRMSADQIAKMARDDGPRRKRVRGLVDAELLTTAEDYIWAAFIFQHGDKPDDYLMACVPGIIATKMDGSGT